MKCVNYEAAVLSPAGIRRIIRPVVLIAGIVLILGGAEIVQAQCEETELASMMASDWARYRHLGRSVSISGDTVVGGAYPEGSEVDAAGWAYVYERDAGGIGNWGEVVILSSDDGWPGDRFGCAVSISGDTIVVGASQDDDAGSGSGSAYVFERDAGGADNWGQVAKLTAFDAAGNDQLGFSVAINGDTIVAGARGEDVEGAAYVFTKPAGGWTDMTETARFKAASPVRNEKFGAAVAISGDTIVVGDYSTPGYAAFGAAYVFVRPGGGWVSATETAKLTASDGEGTDQLGWSVAIDGDVVLVGAPQDDDGGDNSGAAYLFAEPVGGWVHMTETAKIVASDAVASENFGEAVSISGDAALVAQRQHWSADIGAGCLFLFDGADWVEQGKLVPSDGETYDEYGRSLAIDGDQAVIGAPNWDYDPGGVAGRVVGSLYMFDYLSDCDGSGTLDICDIAAGTLHDDDGDGAPDECGCVGDLDGDSDVDLADLAQLLGNYGTTSGAAYEDGDLDGDGDVDLADLAALLAVYGTTC